MLEYYKLILEKVSFDGYLFEKELRKSFNHLLPEESGELIEWAIDMFGPKYYDLISDIQYQLTLS